MNMIAGIFDSEIAANRAVSDLLDEGFGKDDISLLMSEQTRHKLFSSTDDEANRAARGAVAGASIGGVLGALLVGLTAAGAIVTAAACWYRARSSPPCRARARAHWRAVSAAR